MGTFSPPVGKTKPQVARKEQPAAMVASAPLLLLRVSFSFRAQQDRQAASRRAGGVKGLGGHCMVPLLRWGMGLR